MPDRPQPPIDGPRKPDDLLAAYELGLLDESERARFESATATDPELLDDLYDGAPEALMLTADPGRFAAAARAGRTAREAAEQTSWRDRVRAFLRPRVLVPVATALVIMVAVIGPDRDPSSFADLAVLEPIPTTRQTVRADLPEAEASFREAMDAYGDGRWDDAAGLLETALTDGGAGWSRELQARLYLGSSLLLAGDADAATGQLELASTSSVMPIREQATWQLAHARLSVDDAAGARAALQRLTQSPVLGEQATALLAELDQRR